MFVRECPKCHEKVNIEIYQKQNVNSKLSCNKCGARWLVPNKSLKDDVEWKKLADGFRKDPEYKLVGV